MKEIEKRLDSIEKKLEFITTELEAQRQKREEIEEFKNDLNRILKSLFNTIIEEMEDVSDNLKTGTFVYTGKKLIRNLNNLNKLIDQLESIEDFLRDFGPISKRISIDLMVLLEEYDKKGYFTFFKEIMKIFDNIVQNLDEKDLENIAKAVEPAILLLKEFFTKNNMLMLNEFYKAIKNKKHENISSFKLLKELNSKEIRSSLYKIIEAYKEIKKEV